MKLRILLIIQVIFSLSVFSQNLVPNASFEKYDSTYSLIGPYYFNQSFGAYYDWDDIYTGDFYYVDNYWLFDDLDDNAYDSLSQFYNSDSCHLCVPNNYYGYRTPRTGNGYSGIRVYSGSDNHTYKEYIKVPLSQTLEDGVTYKLSFHTCPSDSSPQFINSIGLYLSEFEQFNNFFFTTNTPQILPNSTISNSSIWTEIQGLYKANGNEQHLTIGNFDCQTIFSNPEYNIGSASSYYYIEDVSVFEYSRKSDTTLCSGDTLLLSPEIQENAICNWQNGSNATELAVHQAGTYWLEQSYYWPETSSTVLKYDTFIVNYIPSLTQIEFGADTSLCIGDELTLNRTNINASHEWSNGSNNDNYMVSQEETVWLKEFNECESVSDTINIKYIEKLTLDLGEDISFCYSDTVNLNPTINSTNNNYNWSTGETTRFIKTSEEGIYWLEVQNECEAVIDSIRLSVVSPLSLELGNDTTLCYQEHLNLYIDNSENINIQWQDGSTTNKYRVTKEGTYNVTISNVCEQLTDSITVKKIPRIEDFTLGQDIILCDEDSINISIEITNNEFAHFDWQDQSNDRHYLIDDVGIYWLNVSTICESQTDTLIVKYNCNCELYVPNSFSPNNDGINDSFSTKQKCSYSEFRLQIFNRWGELIFVNDNPDIGCDGKYQNQICQTGLYTYKINYLFNDRNENKKRIIGKVLLTQ